MLRKHLSMLVIITKERRQDLDSMLGSDRCFNFWWRDGFCRAPVKSFSFLESPAVLDKNTPGSACLREHVVETYGRLKQSRSNSIRCFLSRQTMHLRIACQISLNIIFPCSKQDIYQVFLIRISKALLMWTVSDITLFKSIAWGYRSYQSSKKYPHCILQQAGRALNKFAANFNKREIHIAAYLNEAGTQKVCKMWAKRVFEETGMCSSWSTEVFIFHEWWGSSVSICTSILYKRDGRGSWTHTESQAYWGTWTWNYKQGVFTLIAKHETERITLFKECIIF